MNENTRRAVVEAEARRSNNGQNWTTLTKLARQAATDALVARSHADALDALKRALAR